jgi:hypothetical protein
MVQKKGSEMTDSEQKIEKASSMTADYLHEPEFDDESLQCSAQANRVLIHNDELRSSHRGIEH